MISNKMLRGWLSKLQKWKQKKEQSEGTQQPTNSAFTQKDRSPPLALSA